MLFISLMSDQEKFQPTKLDQKSIYSQGSYYTFYNSWKSRFYGSDGELYTDHSQIYVGLHQLHRSQYSSESGPITLIYPDLFD